MGHRAGGLRRPTPARPLRLMGLAGGLLPRRLRLGLLLQDGLGRPNRLEPLRAARQLGRQLITAPIDPIRSVI
ncbi:MAG: hypothetical protein AABZ34_09690 [Nitrospirota bacterium]